MDLTVKKIPDRACRVMKRAAKESGRSLNAQIIRALEEQASDTERRIRMRRSLQALDRFAASLPRLDDSVTLIREDRER